MNILGLIALAKGLSDNKNQNAIPGGEYSQNNVQTANNTAWLPNGLVSGASDFARGFNENRNTPFNADNFNQNQFTVTTPADNTKLVDYQKQLTSQGTSPEVVNAVAEGKNSGNKDIAEWINANQDAYPTTETYDKGFWGKAGEMVGTGYKWANSPVGQAVINGVASTVLTGNPIFGAFNAYAAGSQRANSDIYKQALNKRGIQANDGYFSSVTPEVYKSLTEAELNDMYKRAMIEHYMRQDATKEKANDIKQEYNAQKIAIDNKRADAYAAKGTNRGTVKGSSNGRSTGKGNTKSTPSGYVVGETPNGTRVKVPASKVKEFKSMGGKIVG